MHTPPTEDGGLGLHVLLEAVAQMPFPSSKPHKTWLPAGRRDFRGNEPERTMAFIEKVSHPTRNEQQVACKTGACLH